MSPIVTTRRGVAAEDWFWRIAEPYGGWPRANLISSSVGAFGYEKRKSAGRVVSFDLDQRAVDESRLKGSSQFHIPISEMPDDDGLPFARGAITRDSWRRT